MAVSIDELQVETQQPAPAAPAASSGGGAPQPQSDLKSDMEKLRERDLRLQAD
jgi:hypothetical protein